VSGQHSNAYKTRSAVRGTCVCRVEMQGFYWRHLDHPRIEELHIGSAASARNDTDEANLQPQVWVACVGVLHSAGLVEVVSMAPENVPPALRVIQRKLLVDTCLVVDI